MNKAEELILENQIKILGALSIIVHDSQLADHLLLASRLTRIQINDWKAEKDKAG